MKFYISYEHNEIPQGIIVEAASEDVAARYFKYKKPDAQILEIKEATADYMKPGITVWVVTIFEVWKDSEFGDTYKVKEFFSWGDADSYIVKVENLNLYPGWHFRIAEVKV